MMVITLTTQPLALFLAATVISLLATWGVLHALIRYRVLDEPGARSSHTAPVPRGGGWGIWLTVVPMAAWLGAAAGILPQLAGVMTGFFILLLISWRDDRAPLPPAARFLAQIIAVGLAMQAFPPSTLFLDGLLPQWCDHALAILGWLWFTNLFNFMDGIDGLAATETISVAGGLAAIGILTGALPPFEIALATLLAGAALGFLAHNWAPARVFLGDVGSIPLGFLLAWLLLTLAAHGLWAPALILPLYYLIDATLTLLIRLKKGEKIWLPHRQHFYQQAAGLDRKNHGQVVAKIAALNGILIAFAVAAALGSPWFLAPAGLAVIWTLWRFRQDGAASQAG